MGGEPERDPEVSDLRTFSQQSSTWFFIFPWLEIILLSSPPAFLPPPSPPSSRARSIYERALDVEHRNITLWLKYAEVEMKNRQVNHARNIWDRAITILPRVSQFWWVLGPVSHPESAAKIQHHQQVSVLLPSPPSPVKVQVHLHGGDVGERGGLPAGV